MNEKQAKRIRWATRGFLEAARKSLAPGPSAKDAALQFGKDLRARWRTLNHRERGAFMRALLHGFTPI